MSPKPRFAGISSALAVLVIAFSSATASAADRAKRTSLNRPLNAFDSAAIERAKAGAARKLQSPECQRVFAEFHDEKGRPLRENLEKWGVGPADYLEMVPFLDGSGQPLCRWGKVDLAASPGVPRVFVCGPFAATQLREPRMAEALVIHEMLHTLGLGENPPTSAEITSRVMGRCQ
jgi:hypothetical protein